MPESTANDVTPSLAIGDEIERPAWLDPGVWPYRLRRFVHDGETVHYTDEGTGPTLVLVHAGLWSFVWRDLIAELSADFRCLTLDFPGAGLSPGSRDQVDLAAYSGLLGAWLDALAVDRATFVVHDLGGAVGVAAAAADPERVEGLVAINSFAWPPHGRALRTMLRLVGGPTATGLLGSLRVVPRMTRTRFGVGRHLDRPSRRAFFGPYRRSRTASRNFHRSMRSATRSPALFERASAGLRGPLGSTPLLTVFGEKNDQFGFADAWHDHVSGGQACTLADGNHFPMCDAPGEVASWIRRWHRDRVDEAGPARLATVG